LDIQQIVFRKRDNGFEAAAAQIRNLFKRLFDYAITCQIVSLNPAHATPTRFITRARSRTRALSPDEIKKYLRTLYGSNIRKQFKIESSSHTANPCEEVGVGFGPLVAC